MNRVAIPTILFTFYSIPTWQFWNRIRKYLEKGSWKLHIFIRKHLVNNQVKLQYNMINMASPILYKPRMLVSLDISYPKRYIITFKCVLYEILLVFLTLSTTFSWWVISDFSYIYKFYCRVSIAYLIHMIHWTLDGMGILPIKRATMLLYFQFSKFLLKTLL